MATTDTKRGSRKKFQTIQTVVQSVLISILIILVALMMLYIHKLQGTARVINYTGLVRGATQRLIKLEISQRSDDDLILYLDDILTNLKYGNGSYDLVVLDDEAYNEKLDTLISYWGEIKEQITEVRQSDYALSATETLVDMSEIYFKWTDETVSAAEQYSNKVARYISTIEVISIVDMSFLILILLEQSIYAMKMRKQNMALKQKAYIDLATGLKNKNMCEELLNDTTPITVPTACIMFDMNNLKLTNDLYGHSVGDRLIADFARILKSVVRESDFAGRCGGDEFLLMLYGVDAKVVETVINRLQNEVTNFNRQKKTIPISYAHGWALSTDHPECTYRKLFDEADLCMYANKKKMKAEAAAKRPHIS